MLISVERYWVVSKSLSNKLKAPKTCWECLIECWEHKKLKITMLLPLNAPCMLDNTLGS